MARDDKLVRSDRDLEVLRFVALHGVITAAQAGALLSVDQETAGHVIERLARAGLLRGQRLGVRGPVLFKATAAGLAQSYADRPAERPAAWSPRALWLGWLWLAAGSGELGSPGRVVTGRELRAEDRRGVDENEAEGSQGGSGRTPAAFRVERPFGPVLHYPDLVVVDGRGWVVVELVLSPWSLTMSGALLSAYAGDERVRRVVLAVREPALCRTFVLSPFARGLQGRLDVYPLRLTGELIPAA